MGGYRACPSEDKARKGEQGGWKGAARGAACCPALARRSPFSGGLLGLSMVYLSMWEDRTCFT